MPQADFTTREADAADSQVPGHGRIGVLSGGRSRERARSLLSGNTAHASLLKQGHTAVLMDTAEPGFIDRLQEVDVAFLAIAGDSRQPSPG
jgi:D-alanine-D-alanine ligase